MSIPMCACCLIREPSATMFGRDGEVGAAAIKICERCFGFIDDAVTKAIAAERQGQTCTREHAAPGGPAKRQRWRYTVRKLNERYIDLPRGHTAFSEATMTSYGDAGWELVHVTDGGVVVMRLAVPEDAP